MPMTIQEDVVLEGNDNKSTQVATHKERPVEVMHDEAPAIITSHKFRPKGEWWTLCGFVEDNGERCNLAESAHACSELRYYSDDNPEE